MPVKLRTRTIRFRERQGQDTYYYELIKERIKRRWRYRIRKGLMKAAECHSAIFNRLKKLGIPISTLYDVRTGGMQYTAKDMSKGGYLRIINAYEATIAARKRTKKWADASAYWKDNPISNMRSIVSGITRDLAIMHKNGLFISGRRVVLEPWLVYFRGKENEKQRIASRAITDVGSILETSKMSINDIYDAYMDNIEDLHISFPEEYQSLIDKTYAKYFTSA